MKYLIYSILTIMSHASLVLRYRGTVVRRIQRTTDYITSTRDKLRLGILYHQDMREMFARLNCHQFELPAAVNTSAVWASQMHREIFSDGFVETVWPTLSDAIPMQKIYCVVLRDAIIRRERKVATNRRSINRLERLQELYRSILLELDISDHIDSRYNSLLESAQRYERYANRLDELHVRFHQFLIGTTTFAKAQQMFWPPEETNEVVRQLVDEIFSEDIDADKLMICLEIAEMNGFTKGKLLDMARKVVYPFKVNLHQVANQVLNIEQELLGGE